MRKPRTKLTASIFECLRFIVGSTFTFLVVWGMLKSMTKPNPSITTTIPTSNTPSDTINSHYCTSNSPSSPLKCDPKNPTFYDDPTLTYSIENQIQDWDRKRAQWLKYHHPSFIMGLSHRILVVTGSQPPPCPHPIGDHMLLRLFKNKVDYCRIHNYGIFYNNALLHSRMTGFWAKIQVIKSAMLAHPEVEWIFWIDSDAVFTDMDFKVPLEKYKDYNLVVHGWAHLIYEEKSWVSINSGSFLLRNCQWSIDLLTEWAKMGPQTPNYDKWSKILSSTLKDKVYPQADDQSGLVYLLLAQKKRWADKTYIENEYPLHGYWVGIVDRYVNVTEKYRDIERNASAQGSSSGRLRRRHAEIVSEHYGELWENEFKGRDDFGNAEYGSGESWWKRPFVTHFTGCQPCNGNHAENYEKESCWEGMKKALNFADNQVLRNYGFVHPDLLDSRVVPIFEPHYYHGID